MKPKCLKCGKEVGTRVGSYLEIEGFEVVSTSSAGSANQITLKKRTGRVMCAPCGTLAKTDHNKAQEKLWA